MYFPERVSKEDYERYCSRCLRLFLSVDIVNSTALKQEFREKDDSWLSIARSFYTAFPTFVASALDALPAVDAASKPILWKAIGDELVFVSEIERMDAIPTLLRALRTAVNRWNREKEGAGVLVKGGAWLAGFPVMNSIIPGEVKGRHDYIGSSIDTGFRLCRFASPRHLVIGIEVAYVVAQLADPLVNELHFEGRQEIRGGSEGPALPDLLVGLFFGRFRSPEDCGGREARGRDHREPLENARGQECRVLYHGVGRVHRWRDSVALPTWRGRPKVPRTLRLHGQGTKEAGGV